MSALVAGPTPVRTLVYTCCDRAYEDFVALFAWAALAANPDCAVEVGVESAEAFFVENGAAADAVGARFGADRFVVHEVPFATSDGTRIRPNTVRFVTTPRIVTRYVYIADVDVIMLEPGLTEMHREHAPARLHLQQRRAPRDPPDVGVALLRAGISLPAA